MDPQQRAHASPRSATVTPRPPAAAIGSPSSSVKTLRSPELLNWPPYMGGDERTGVHILVVGETAPAKKQAPKQGTPPSKGRRGWVIALIVVLVLAVAGIGLGVGLSGSGTKPKPKPKVSVPVIPKTLPTGTASRFVGRQGKNLTYDGDWFRFSGVDNYVMLGCGTSAQQISTPQAQDAFFAGLRAHSVTRLWLFKGANLGQFDSLLAAAARHGQFVLPTLADGVGGCGESVKDVAWLRSGYKGDYLTWLRTVAQRYKASPTIMMWDLINEPPRTDPTALRAFIDDAGAILHSVDPNHLVTVGTNLPSEYQGTTGYGTIFSSPQIDAVSLHEYDQLPSASHHLAEALATATAVNKPVIIGEYGVFASPNGDPNTKSANGSPCLSFAARATLVRAKLADDFKQPGVAGALYWSFTANTHSECSLETFAGDSLMSQINAADLYPGVARLHRQ